MTTYVLVEALPPVLNLRDHSTEVVGGACDRTFTAIYGLNGAAMGLRHTHGSMEQGVLSLTVQSLLELPHFHQRKKDNSRSTVMETGFLHTGTVAAEYREELRQEFLEHLARKHGAAFASELRHLKLRELMLRRPELAGRILHTEPRIRLVVYLARLPGMDESQSIYVGTMRKRDARLLSAQVRYLEDSILVRH